MTTIKQKLAVAKIMESHGAIAVSRAMEEVGYDPTTAKNPKNLTESKGWKELMDDWLPDDKLLKAHDEALDAVKIVTSPTEADSILPDHMIRLKAVELGYKVKGKLQPESVNNFAIGEMSVQFRERE